MSILQKELDRLFSSLPDEQVKRVDRIAEEYEKQGKEWWAQQDQDDEWISGEWADE